MKGWEQRLLRAHQPHPTRKLLLRGGPHVPARLARNMTKALILCLDFSSNFRSEFPSSGPLNQLLI